MENKLGKILIVDDDPLVLEALKQTYMDEYEILEAVSGFEAIDLVNANNDIDTIVLDIKMAKLDGLATASKIKEINSELPIIFHTGYPGDFSEENIEKKYQPFDYVGKNERPARLSRAVKNAVLFYRLKSSKARLMNLAREEFGMIGKTDVMFEVFQVIEKIGPTDNKVMILGPTGTGKELVARAIHKRSNRYDKPLVIFNCNHKAPDLVESELFGHIKGSFTGAIADRVGLFEYADDGTLFLDEIGDLDITTQAKILRVIESGEMYRIGSPETISVNVRLICATNHDLPKMVEEDRFREDLYYRLKGVTINLPSLKDRPEDILDMVDFFTENHCVKYNTAIKIFEQEARDFLIEYEWPGNVRQLLDTVQSLIDLSPSYYITKKDVLHYLSQSEKDIAHNDGLTNQIKEFKRLLIIKSLDKHNQNVAAAARDLSLDPSNLRKIIKELNISTG